MIVTETRWAFSRMLSGVGLVLLLCLAGAAPTQANGSAAASFSLRPVRYDPNRPETQSYFIYDAIPGQEITTEVQLANIGTAAGTVRLYAVDATTGRTSNVIYLGGDRMPVEVGQWVTLSERQVTLAPGEARQIAFTVRVPPDATPGQHVGGLIAEDVALYRGESTGSFQISLQNRVATAVQINLPGPTVERMAVTRVGATVEQGYQMVLIGLRNEGNQMTKPLLRLSILDERGQLLRQQTAQLGTFLPQTEIDYPLPLDGAALPSGRYQVEVGLTYGTTENPPFLTQFDITTEQVAALYAAREQQLPDQQPRAATGAISMTLLVPIVGATLFGLLLGLVVARRGSRARG